MKRGIEIYKFTDKDGKTLYTCIYGKKHIVNEQVHVALWDLATWLNQEEDLRDIALDPKIVELPFIPLPEERPEENQLSLGPIFKGEGYSMSVAKGLIIIDKEAPAFTVEVNNSAPPLEVEAHLSEVRIDENNRVLASSTGYSAFGDMVGWYWLLVDEKGSRQGAFLVRRWAVETKERYPRPESLRVVLHKLNEPGQYRETHLLNEVRQ